MRYGISAAALVVQDERILLVNHKEAGRYDFWLPPGGSLEGEESIFQCAQRETIEETGLEVELDRIVYIQEFVEPGYHFCKFMGKSQGTPQLAVGTVPWPTLLSVQAQSRGFILGSSLQDLDSWGGTEQKP